MDVANWLRSLGLGKYEAVFRENEIDETVLPSLTEEHLKQLGVTALGHRVKLLDAIAALRNDASGRAPYGTTLPPLGAVRRQRGHSCDGGPPGAGILFGCNGMAPEEVFGSHELLRVVESYRNFLAEADYGPHPM
jgi:hypothetical protein